MRRRVGVRETAAIAAVGLTAMFGVVGESAESVGAAGAVTCTGAAAVIIDQFYPDTAVNGATTATISTGGKAYCLTHIATYHWNDGKGAPAGGSIGLVDVGGQTIGGGPWKASATPATNGVLANWEADVKTDPPVVLDGTYRVTEVDPTAANPPDPNKPPTWSMSKASGGMGYVRVWGEAAVPVAGGANGSAPSSVATSKAPSGGGGGGSGALIAIVVAVLLGIGGLITWLVRRTPRRSPGVAVVPRDCGCSCQSSISGPLSVNICPCHQVTYHMAGSGQQGRLQAIRADGETAWSKSYRCNIVTECIRADEVERNVAWAVTQNGDVLTITATATVSYKCVGDTSDSTTTCVAPPFKVKLLPGSGCTVEVVTLTLGWTELIGHVGIRIVCGEEDDLWGYFPKDRASLTAPFKGTPGSVDHRSSGDDRLDTIGKEYANYYCSNAKKVWAIQLTCAQCEALRRYWEQLTAAPGTYILASSNCATHAIDSLRAAGVPLNLPSAGLPPPVPVGPAGSVGELYQWAKDAYRPGLVDDLMNQLAREGGASSQLEIPANPNCTSEH